MNNNEAIITDANSVNLQFAYFWIKKFIKLANQEVNFGSPYDFKFDQEAKALKIANNPNYIENLFATKNSRLSITNVSAIAGRNGSGKSSVLRFILDQFLDNSGGIDADCIAVVMLNGQPKVYVNLPYGITIEADNDILSLDPIYIRPEVKNLNSTPSGRLHHYSRINVFDSIHTDFVYVNPAFELKPQIDSNLNRCDLSTNHFLDNDFGRLSSVDNVNEKEELNFDSLISSHRELINAISIESDINSQKEALSTSLKKLTHAFEYSRIQRLERHAFSEIERIARLISDHRDTELYSVIKDHATIPETLTVRLQRNWVQDFKSLPEEPNRPSDNITKLLQSIGTQIYLKFFNEPESGNWQKRLIIETILMLIYVGSRNSMNHIERIVSLESDIKSFDYLDEVIASLVDAYCGFLMLMPNAIRNDLASYMSSIANLEPSFSFGNDNIGYSEYNIKMDNPKAVSAFLQAYRDLVINHGVFYFDWHAISAGEQNRLSLFARLHTLADNKKHQPLRRNIFLLIDEGDLGYHPEWKRTFIDSLVSFVSKDWEPKGYNNGFDSPKERNVQVILTTNEPFLLSDIPSYNVTILGDPNNEMSDLECFGANINELYTKGFFVESLIGEFAKKKIIDGFKAASHKKNSKQTVLEIRKLSKIIGEPIVAQSLIRALDIVARPKGKKRDRPNA